MNNREKTTKNHINKKEEKTNSSFRFFTTLFMNKYILTLTFILIISFLLRFYNFPNRWGLASDDARDISIAREALQRHELPLIGSFSSAGPFVFGPLFYWFLMASYLLLPFTITAPWIFEGLVGVVTVIVFYVIGKEIKDRKFALLLAALVATSPQLVIRSLLLGQHTFVAITAVLLLMSFLFLWNTRKTWYAFLMGLWLGIGLSMHYQSINLLIFFVAPLFIPHVAIRDKVKFLIFMGIGFLIPSLPLLIWDSQQQFANIRNLLDYLLVGQYRLYVPNSWKLFLFHYLPDYWSFVAGGNFLMGFILMALSFITILYFFIIRKTPRVILLLEAIFFILLLVNRFYKGERSESYLLYLVSFILLFSGFALYMLISFASRQKYVTMFIRTIGVILLVATLLINIKGIRRMYGNNGVNTLQEAAKMLISKYPDRKFTLYDYKGGLAYRSQPFSVILKQLDRTDPKGMAIGFIEKKQKNPWKKYPFIITVNDAALYDLSSVQNINRLSQIWYPVNQEAMYDSLIGWSKKHELKSNFSLTTYLKAKL